MTVQEKYKEHVEKHCKGCKIKECNGITIKMDGKTRCAKED